MKVKKKSSIFVSPEQMRSIDALAAGKYGIASLILMENAGQAVAAEAEKTLKKLNKKKVAVVCGSGNNAGDGFVAARYLKNKGFNVIVVLTKSETSFKGDCKTNFEILKKLEADISYDINCLNKNGLIVDAVLGTGVEGCVKDEAACAVSKINNSKAFKMSVDIPSGMNGESGEIMGCAVKADKTVTFAFQKNAFKNAAAKKYTGKIITADIGIPEKAAKEIIEYEKI